ncbi:MAG: cellulase family glycosylhydrolase [Nitrospirae bacterium]|nr:cellulase family glycosylhydrolase [Nitrospirota bacterium]
MFAHFLFFVIFCCTFSFISNLGYAFETNEGTPFNHAPDAPIIKKTMDLTSSLTVYKGHNLPRLRGAMISANVSGPDLLELGLKWNANLVRWQLNWIDKSADKTDMQAYDKWLEKSLKMLDYLLPTLKKASLMVVIDLHTPPGGMNKDNEQMIFKEKKYQNKLLAVWKKIALRYKSNDVIWGYDIVNEPIWREKISGLLDWQSLAELTAKNIREIDPDHAIIVQPGDWGNPNGFNDFKPLSTVGIVYSFHMYVPHTFTHQEIGVFKDVGLNYPGIINGRMWNKDQLRIALKPVVDFQKKYGVHIYVGEFSAIVWAPGNSTYNYLKDAIDIFEENGWDWSYHAFREWTGWSVEHHQDRKDAKPIKMQTDRQILLETWFAKNEKPKFVPQNMQKH